MPDLSRELPNEIFIPLGRKGFHPINLKACIKCSNAERFVLDFYEKVEHPLEETDTTKKEITDYKVKCKNCGAEYQIRMIQLKRIVDGKEERMLINFNILDKDGNDEGWLGSLYK